MLLKEAATFRRQTVWGHYKIFFCCDKSEKLRADEKFRESGSKADDRIKGKDMTESICWEERSKWQRNEEK